MVKSYLGYSLKATLGVIYSPTCPNVLMHSPDGFIANAPKGQLQALSPSIENMSLWNMRQSKVTAICKGKRAEVTSMARSSSGDLFAAGYADGSVAIFRSSGEEASYYRPHNGSPVLSMDFDSTGTLLASAGSDTTIVIYDIIAEQSLSRLSGHKDAVTGIKFLNRTGLVVSTSKDKLLKVWDHAAQFCVQTLVGTRSDIMFMDVDQDETRLVASSVDHEVRVWDLVPLLNGLEDRSFSAPNTEVRMMGVLARQSRDKPSSISFSSNPIEQLNAPSCLSVISSDETIEIFEFKKPKVNNASVLMAAAAISSSPSAEDDIHHTVETDFVPICALKFDEGRKLKAIDTCINKEKGSFSLQLLVGFLDNALEMWTVPLSSLSSSFAASSSAAAEKAEAVKASKLSSIHTPGHRTDIRSLLFNPLDETLISASGEAVKVWNPETQECLRTIPSGYGVSLCLAPGNKHVFVGTKAGDLELYSLSTGQQMEKVAAHSGAIWTVLLKPSQDGLVTAGADHDVKFWDFELILDPETGTRKLSVKLVHTLQMTDDVLSARFSPDGRILALALLDNTVKLFYTDTLKFFISLYGHSLPVTSMDISSDSRLLITGSADKDVKIWGLEFGDCHRSLFAQQDSVMSVQFVPSTHYFFSVGKDGSVKYWDADKFEHITTIGRHHREIWALNVNQSGLMVAAGGHDRSIRIYERTEEQIFLEEEREKEREEQMDKAMEDDPRKLASNTTASSAVTAVSEKKSAENLKSGELLVEAMDLADMEELAATTYENEKKRLLSIGNKSIPAAPAPNPLLLGLQPHAYVLRTLKRVRTAALEDTLSVLTFTDARRLVRFLLPSLKAGVDCELIVRAVLFLVHVHHNGFTADLDAQSYLMECSTQIKQVIYGFRRHIGFNVAGLEAVKRDIESNLDVGFIDLRTASSGAELSKPKRKEFKSHNSRTGKSALAADAGAAKKRSKLAR